jgi:hypothetical protein
MTKPLQPEGRLQSLGEEIANSLSFGIRLTAVTHRRDSAACRIRNSTAKRIQAPFKCMRAKAYFGNCFSSFFIRSTRGEN